MSVRKRRWCCPLPLKKRAAHHILSSLTHPTCITEKKMVTLAPAVPTWRRRWRWSARLPCCNRICVWCGGKPLCVSSGRSGHRAVYGKRLRLSKKWHAGEQKGCFHHTLLSCWSGENKCLLADMCLHLNHNVKKIVWSSFQRIMCISQM